MKYLFIVIVALYLTCPIDVFSKPLGEFEKDYGTGAYEKLSYKDVSYSGWNKFWFYSAIAGQAADIGSTAYKLRDSSTCSEGNTIYGSDPNYVLMGLFKVAVLTGAYFYAEKMPVKSEDERRAIRNYIYSPFTVIGFGATAWNLSRDCN